MADYLCINGLHSFVVVSKKHITQVVANRLFLMIYIKQCSFTTFTTNNKQ